MDKQTHEELSRPEKHWLREGCWLDRKLEQKYGSSLFSYRKIFSMLLPLILDSFFVMAIQMLTTAMISSSSQESVSAVSLIGPLNMMIYAVYNAISAGGTVIVAQYKGSGEPERMKHAAGQLLMVTPLSAIIAAVILITFSQPIIQLLFGGVGPEVAKKAQQYLIGVSISSVFLGVYMSGFSVFRGLGETKICLRLTVLINLLHFLCSFLFINIWKLDIFGSVLALNVARLVGGGAAVWKLLSPKSVLRVEKRHMRKPDKHILRAIFSIGIPFGMEQLFMNGGSMLVQIYVARLGTTGVAANAIANSIFGMIQSAPGAVATLAITVIGQCYGAGNLELSRRYGKSMVSLSCILSLITLAVCLPCMPWILMLYQAPPETVQAIYGALFIASVCMPLLWPISTIMPSVLRATGDAKFSSYFSLVTMWIIRVGMGYVFAITLGLGVNGVWCSMVLEWAVRSVVFWLRYRSDVWLRLPDPA